MAVWLCFTFLLTQSGITTVEQSCKLNIAHPRLLNELLSVPSAPLEAATLVLPPSGRLLLVSQGSSLLPPPSSPVIFPPQPLLGFYNVASPPLLYLHNNKSNK